VLFKRKSFNRVLFGTSLFLISTLCCIFLYRLSTKTFNGTFQHPINNVKEITQITGIDFPNNAVILDSKTSDGFSPYLIAKIKMPRTEVNKFIEQPTLHGLLSRTQSYLHEGKVIEMQQRGWKLGHIHHYLAADNIPLSKSYNTAGAWIIIDLDNPHTVILYLYFQG